MLRSKFLAAFALMALVGCSRAQKPSEASAAAPSLPAPAEQAAAPVPEVPVPLATTPEPAPGETLIASAPHPQTLPDTNAPTATPPPADTKGLTLHLLVPAGHGPGWLAEELQATLGAKVVVQTYDDEAGFLAALRAPGAAWDVVGLTDRAAADLVAAKQLRPFPVAAAPLAEQPAAEFLHHYFDFKNDFTWPYGFTLLGFAHATPPPGPGQSQSAKPLHAWRDLAAENLTVSLPADPALRAALWALAEGKPPAANDPLPAAWQKAEATEPAAGQEGHVWIDTVAKLHALAARPNEKWEVALPPEGSLIVLYSWAIPAATAQPQLAEAALRALEAPARAARLDVENNLAATQPAARASLAPSVSADPLVYPAEGVLNKSRFVRAAAAK